MVYSITVPLVKPSRVTPYGGNVFNGVRASKLHLAKMGAVRFRFIDAFGSLSRGGKTHSSKSKLAGPLYVNMMSSPRVLSIFTGLELSRNAYWLQTLRAGLHGDTRR